MSTITTLFLWPLLVGAVGTVIWYFASEYFARLYWSKAQKSDGAITDAERGTASHLLREYGIPVRLMDYVVDYHGGLRMHFPHPTASVGVYDFCLEKLPPEKQLALARRLIEEYHLSSRSAKQFHDVQDEDTIARINMQLVGAIADVALGSSDEIGLQASKLLRTLQQDDRLTPGVREYIQFLVNA